MSGVIDLTAWRRDRRGEDGDRLTSAVARIDDMVDQLGWSDRRAPEWLLTEVLAIQGCIALEMDGQAASRADRLARRLYQLVERARRRRAR
jgi:hypothetical protein